MHVRLLLCQFLCTKTKALCPFLDSQSAPQNSNLNKLRPFLHVFSLILQPFWWKNHIQGGCSSKNPLNSTTDISTCLHWQYIQPTGQKAPFPNDLWFFSAQLHHHPTPPNHHSQLHNISPPPTSGARDPGPVPMPPPAPLPPAAARPGQLPAARRPAAAGPPAVQRQQQDSLGTIMRRAVTGRRQAFAETFEDDDPEAEASWPLSSSSE